MHIVQKLVNMGTVYDTPLRKTLLKTAIWSGAISTRVSCLGIPVFKSMLTELSDSEQSVGEQVWGEYRGIFKVARSIPAFAL